MPRAATRDGTYALVLAAGASRRFGGGKLGAPYRSRPLVVWAVEAALATRAKTVTVVVGADSEPLRTALTPLESERLSVAFCADWSAGLSASLRCGVESLPADMRAVLIFLGDMPLVSPALADRLLDEVLGGAPAAMPVHRGVPGHPVAVAGAHRDALLRLEGDRGARGLLQALGAVRIETADPGSVRDVDTRHDLEALDAQGAPA